MPNYFIFEVTPHCQLDCDYCYNVWKHSESYPKYDTGKYKRTEMAPQDIRILFSRLQEQTSIGGVTLTGGEPMLRVDLEVIAQELVDLKIPVFIATNGELLTKERLTALNNIGIEYVEISLNTLSNNTDRQMGRISNLKRIKQALLTAKHLYMNAGLSFLLTRINYYDLENVLKTGFAFKADRIAINTYTCREKNFRYKLTHEQLETALSIADRFAEIYPLRIDVTLPIRFCELNRKHYPHLHFGPCFCGEYKWAIDSQGNLRTCEQNPQILGNLLQTQWEMLRQKPVVKDFKKQYFREDCPQCEFYTICGGGCRFDH